MRERIFHTAVSVISHAAEISLGVSASVASFEHCKNRFSLLRPQDRLRVPQNAPAARLAAELHGALALFHIAAAGEEGGALPRSIEHHDGIRTPRQAKRARDHVDAIFSFQFSRVRGHQNGNAKFAGQLLQRSQGLVVVRIPVALAGLERTHGLQHVDDNEAW